MGPIRTTMKFSQRKWPLILGSVYSLFSHLFRILGVFGDNLPEEPNAVIDAATILLLNQVVDLPLVGLHLGGVGIRGGRRPRRTLQRKKTGLGI